MKTSTRSFLERDHYLLSPRSVLKNYWEGERKALKYHQYQAEACSVIKWERFKE
jgi:hypothetical protein